MPRLKIFKSAKKVEITPGEMSDMDINMISLVRKGANKQKIQIYKEDEELENVAEEDEKGLFEVLKSFFAGKIEKADGSVKKTKVPKKTFSGMMAVNDITDNMWRANDTLRSVMRDIINNEEVTDKKAALLQAIDEYSSYMKNKINTTAISKGDSFFDVPETEIEKAGKKVSSKNLEALKVAQKALSAVIDEAELNNQIKNEEEEKDVKKEELTEIMKQTMEAALKPINDRLDKIEKADIGNEQKEGEEVTEETENVTEIIKSIVTEALCPLEERLEKVEKSRGIARSLEGEETTEKIEKDATDVFEGYFA